MKTELTKDEKAVVYAAVTDAITNGKKWSAPQLHYPVSALIAAVEEIGLVKHEREYDTGPDGFSTNGWQYDWWQGLKDANGVIWVLAGSGYYGGLSFFKDEE